MEFIEEFETALNLWTDGNIADTLSKAKIEDLYKFAETASLISKYHFASTQKPNENFSFTANSSLSGGRHPCASPGCRIDRLDQLVSFASLYADEVYIENPFEKVILSSDKNFDAFARQELISGIYNFLYLKPLFKNGIIKYANNMVSLCDHHANHIAKPLSESIEKKKNDLYNILHEYLIEECTVIFDIGKGAGPFFLIKGPEEFLAHGAVYFHLYNPLPTFAKPFKKKELPYQLSKQEIIDNEILEIVISPILEDLANLEWHSAFYGTSYLCDKKMQMKIASKINSDTYQANSEAFENAISHYLPAIHTKNPQALIDLREREQEAFKVYRDKLNLLIRHSNSWDEKEISKIFRDEVLPEINLIDKKINDWKLKTKGSLKEKILFGSGAISVGLYAGVLPPNIGDMVAAIGGGSAIVSALIDYNKTLKIKDEARINDFYFLWQAGQ